MRSPYPLNLRSSSAIKKPSSDSFKIFILLIAFLLKPSLKSNIQVPCLFPRPTLPLNWCNWARPNLFAFSIIIRFALGKSIPTSITVVDTNIDIFFSKNFFKIFCFSSFFNAPWIKPTLFLNFFSIISNFFLTDE